MMHPSYTALVFLNVVFAIAMVLTLRAIFSSSGWQTYVGEADVLPDVHHHQPQCVALDGPPARLSPLQLNLFWLMRCRTLPITEWYGNLSGAANATALPMNALRWMGHDQGVLLPLHAMYLSLLGFMYEYAITWQWSGWSNHGSDVALMEAWVKGGKQHEEQPRHHHHHHHHAAAAAAPATSAMEALYAHDAPPPTPFYANLGPADEVLLSSSALTYESMLPVVLPLRQVHGFLLAMVVIVVGVHLTWRLCFTVASMLAHAVAAHAEAEIAEDAPTLRSHDARDVLIARSARAGAVVLLLAGILPTFVLELITLAPACLSTLLVLYAIVLLVELEAEVLCPPSHSLNDAIHLYKTTSAPLGASGNIAFYGLRHRPSAMRMIMAVALSALAAALFRPAAYVAPVMLMWALTLCYQLAHTRVLVCSTTRNTATGELVATPIAYSSVYEARWLHMRLCGVVLALVGAMCCASVPFLYQTQQWSQIPALMNAWMGTRQEVVPSSSSSSPTYAFGATCPGTLTHADAVRVHAQPPSPNAWLLSDLYGYPSWSTILPHVAQKLLHYHNTTHAQEQMCEDSSMWVNYLGMVMVVMCSAVPMFALAAYRLRRAPLVFDTPASFAENERRYEAEYARYWQDRSAGKRPPSSSSSPATSSAASKVHATSITREEYLVKQIILLMMIALIITTAASIFVLNSSATSYIMIIPIAALLMAVRNIIMKLRNAAPKALFYHDGDGASADSSISTYMAETSSDWCRHSTAVLTDNMDDIIIVSAAAAYAHAAAPLLRDVLRPLNVAENVVAWIVVQAWARVVWEMIRGSYKRGHGAWIQWSLALVLMLVAFFVNVPTSAGGSTIVSEIIYGVWPRATAEEVPSSWRQRCTFSASALAPLDASSSIHACISILLGLCVVVLGSRRVLRLAVETEEVSFGSPESELGTFAQRPKSAPSPARRVQRRR